MATTTIATIMSLRRILAAALVISCIPVIVGAIFLNVLSLLHLIIALIIYIVAMAMLLWLVAGKVKVVSRLYIGFISVVTVLMIGININTYNMIRTTGEFMGGIQATNTTYIEYSIVAKKDASVTLNTAKTVGSSTSDPLYTEAKQALAVETPAAPHDYDNLTSLTESLRAGQVELGSLRSASLDILRDNDNELYQQLVVLGTFRVKVPQTATADADVEKPFILYISGIDTYGDVAEVSRSDVNMLMVVNPAHRSMLLVNTPRDYYVQLHGTTGTKDKLTHAGIYGIDMSRQTMEDLYGVKIPYYMRLNFTSLVKLIDTIGPITVYSDYAFKSYNVGYNTLDSKHALEFARERHSFEDGDRQRGRNQQRVIEAIIAKISQPQNITHYGSILDTLQGALQTNLSKNDLSKLVRMQMDDLRRWSVASIDVNGTGSARPTYSMGSMPLYVMIPDQQTLTTAKTRIAQTLGN